MQWSNTSPARRCPCEELDGAVDRDALLVPGDQERDRALEPAPIRGEIIERGGELAGDRALHVDGTAAVEHAAVDVAGERPVGPPRLVARRDHIGMAGEHEIRPAAADARIEVLDVVGSGLGERDALDREAGALEPIGKIGERAAFRRRHRGTAQEITGEGDGIGGHDSKCLQESRDEVKV